MKPISVWTLFLAAFTAIFAAFSFSILKYYESRALMASSLMEIASISEKVALAGRSDLLGVDEETLPLVFKYSFASSKNQPPSGKKVRNAFDYEVGFKFIEMDNVKRILITYPIPLDVCKDVASLVNGSGGMPFLVMKHQKFDNYSRPSQPHDVCEVTESPLLTMAI